jgi:hypothetical protein
MRTKFSNRENMNAASAFVLLVLIIFLFKEKDILVYVAIGVLLFAAINSKLLYPVSFVWYNLTLILSKITTTFLLSLVFILIVTPVGLMRKLAGKDTLKLKLFKKGQHSVLIFRDYRYCSTDLTNPY